MQSGSDIPQLSTSKVTIHRLCKTPGTILTNLHTCMNLGQVQHSVLHPGYGTYNFEVHQRLKNVHTEIIEANEFYVMFINMVALKFSLSNCSSTNLKFHALDDQIIFVHL